MRRTGADEQTLHLMVRLYPSYHACGKYSEPLNNGHLCREVVGYFVYTKVLLNCPSSSFRGSTVIILTIGTYDFVCHYPGSH